MTNEEQVRRLASLPIDRAVYFDMGCLSRGKWVWRVSWRDASGVSRILYLGRDSEGLIARRAFAQPAPRLYRMEIGRKRLQRRGAFVGREVV